MKKELNQIIKKIESISNNNDEIMDIKDICKYLGMSKSYLYKLTMKGAIPHYKPLGKRIYFSKLEIDKWVKNNEGGEL